MISRLHTTTHLCWVAAHDNLMIHVLHLRRCCHLILIQIQPRCCARRLLALRRLHSLGHVSIGVHLIMISRIISVQIAILVVLHNLPISIAIAVIVWLSIEVACHFLLV